MKKALCLAAIILSSGCAIEGFNPVRNTPWGGMDYLFETPGKKEENKNEKKPVTDYMDRCSTTNKTNSGLTYIK